MAEPPSKRYKRHENEASSNGPPIVTDPRFANIQSDPRYRLPSKRRANVRVDKRFSHMLRDDDFARKAKVDRYGRPLAPDAERKRMKRRYDFEDGIDDDDEVQEELKRVGEALDPMRDGGYSQSSSSDESSSEEDESDEEAEVHRHPLESQPDSEVPLGDVSSRIAVVNLDWDNIRAADLMAVFSSFLPSGGRLLKASIYPSQFGRECMSREEMEGPPKEIFASGAKVSVKGVAEGDGDDLQNIKDSLVQPDAGEDFDSAALRRYQLQRLQYYYAILKFSSSDVARSVYDTVDGAEYLTTANFFDLRFVPEDLDFVDDRVRDECDSIPAGYRPNDFVTDALQHSNVKLTWDVDDVSRKTAQAKAFRGSRKDIDENDLKAYLGSDSSSDEEIRIAENSQLPKKEQERQRMRSLLGLGAEPEKISKSKDTHVGDLQITFSSGLWAQDGVEPSVFKDEAEPEETTVEKYLRKERERKKERKQRPKAAHEGTSNQNTGGGNDASEQAEDLGFDDPFFAVPNHDQASAAKMRKEDRLKRRSEKQAEDTAAAAERAELELLMVDDQDGDREVRHFDMKEIERNEKRSKKKSRQNKKHRAEESGRDTVKVDLEIDTNDPRFSRIYENHEFAIDPTNPRFRGTAGMRALLEETRRHKKKNQEGRESKEVVQEISSASHQSTNDVKKLVDKLKSREKQ